jgi:hypothetical protein
VLSGKQCGDRRANVLCGVLHRAAPLTAFKVERGADYKANLRHPSRENAATTPQAVRAAYGDGENWHAAAQCKERRTIAKRAESSVATARPLGVDPEEMPLGKDSLSETERLKVGGATTYAKDAIDAQELSDDRPTHGLCLPHPVEWASGCRRQPAGEKDGIHPRDVIPSKDRRAARRHMLEPDDLDALSESTQRPSAEDLRAAHPKRDALYLTAPARCSH